MTSTTIGQTAKSDKERFIGTWTLVSIASGEGDVKADRERLEFATLRITDKGRQALAAK
jgi:hypothetical protein